MKYVAITQAVETHSQTNYIKMNTLSMPINRIVLCQPKHVSRCMSEQLKFTERFNVPKDDQGSHTNNLSVSVLLYGVYKLNTLLTFIKIFYLALIYLWKPVFCKFHYQDW